MTEWTTPPPVRPLQPEDAFAGIDATVLDFWRFAMSDLKTNNVRGYLAEFLVARAVGATGPRVEWDSFDVLSPEGIRIEVKSSAYVQSWAQRRPSQITFSGLRGQRWTPQGGYSAESTYNADVYVFAIHTAKSHDAYDPLDVSQWQFHVVTAETIATTNQRSIGVASLQRLAGAAVSWSELGDAIRAVFPRPTPDGPRS